jgi:peptidoglycan/xylan/chitin deacetylase (PgdA/CDA1 family)
MYHGTTPGRQRPASRYSIASDHFRAQLDLLSEYGWHTACLRDCADATLPPQSVFITFDDGYANNYDGAFLPLVTRGLRATWFMVSARTRAEWLDAPEAERHLLAPSQLIEMNQAGMEIGSHTRTHADLTTLTDAQRHDELHGARQELEALLKRSVDSFAYPYGRHNATTVQACAAVYARACTTRPGRLAQERDPHRLRRVTIFADDTLGEFARKLVFASNDTCWRTMARYGLARVKARLGLRHA